MNNIPKKYYDKLKTYLNEGEKVEHSITEAWVPRSDKRWLIITNQRLIVMIKGLWDIQFHDYPYSALDLDIDFGFLFDEIQMNYTGKLYNAQFTTFKREETLNFFQKLKLNLSSFARRREGDEEKDPEDVNSLMYLLKELAKLKDDKVITKKEFEEKKKEILKRI